MATGPEYSRALQLDPTCLPQEALDHFPLLVDLEDPVFKDGERGGRVARADGGDIHFSDANGDLLPFELKAYDPRRGALQAWVAIPRLAVDAPPALFLCCGGQPIAPPGSPWDAHYCLVAERGADPESPAAAQWPWDRAITVEAWVHSDDKRAEALQPLVSQWRPASAFGRFSAYDAGCTDQLASRGYFGAVFDGRYVYFCPARTASERTAVHGTVLRCDTQGYFAEPTSWQAYDASHTDGLFTAGFYGGAFDGRYVYFNPRDDGKTHHSRLLRYDTHSDFTAPQSWQAHDIGLAHSAQGLAFDGRYIYCCPGYSKAADAPFDDSLLSAAILRIDTSAPIDAPATYEVFDATATGAAATCFDGALFDGRHIYFAPLSGGVVLRYAVAGEFSDPSSWQTYDASPLGMHSNVGVLFDGRHIYFCAYGNSTMLRYDTAEPFANAASWQVYQAADTDGLDTGGFDGAFFDGRYIYFVPFTRQVPAGQTKSQFHGNYLRYDTAGPFADRTSWSAKDTSVIDGLNTTAYNAGAFDGRYFYAAPWRGDLDEGRAHGRVLRCDTLGEDGAFSLRYCDVGHNGGLNAAVLGPNFLVNTTAGAVSIAAHQPLEQGWHHLAGVYDGDSIKLFVDGELVAQRGAHGAPLQPNSAPITIGHLGPGAARFDGTIAQVRLSTSARSAAWLKGVHQSLKAPRKMVSAAVRL